MEQKVKPDRLVETRSNDTPGTRLAVLQKGIVGYLAGCFGIAAVTAFGRMTGGNLNEATVALAMLLVVLFVANIWGSRPGLLSSVLAGVAFDYYFLPPSGTLYIADPRNWTALAAFLITAITVGHLSARAKRRALRAEAGQRDARVESAYHRGLIEASLDPLVTIGTDGKITDANAATEAITGRGRAEIVGTDFSEHFTDPVQARAAYERAFKEGFVRDYPLEIRGPDGTGIAVIYNASVYRDEKGAVAGVFAAARDISAIARAEREIRHLASFPERSPVPIIEFNRGMNVQFMNAAMKSTLEECGIGSPRLLIPEEWVAKLAQASHGDEADVLEIDVSGHSFLEQLFFSQEFQTLRIWATDISERKEAERTLERLNRSLRTLSNANQTLVRATNEQELLQNMCAVLIETGRFRMAWIGLAEQDEGKTVRVAAIAGFDEGYVDRAHISWADSPRGRGPTGTAIRTGKPQINRDFIADPRMGPWREEALKRGYASSIALPLRGAAGIFGALTIYAGEEDAFGGEEVEVFKELAADLGYGIAALRSFGERQAAMRQLRESLERTVGALASTVETRDPYTAGHQRRVAQLASGIAGEMGLREEQIHGIFLAGLIHDVGKINVPADLLSKPGVLTPLEMQLVRIHAQAGYDIIKGITFPWPVAQAVLQHHERLDGSGYPRGLSGEAIIVEARILAVADVMETIMSHRPYRPAKGLGNALAEIKNGKGRLYDAAAVDACVDLFMNKRFSFESSASSLHVRS